MRKAPGVLGLAAAALVVGLALTSGYAEQALGRSSCPSGTQKFTHVCIEKSLPFGGTSANFSVATQSCAVRGRRLPTSAELNAFRQQEGIEIGIGPLQGEWTSDFTSASNAIIINDDGDYTESSINTPHLYRCVK